MRSAEDRRSSSVNVLSDRMLNRRFIVAWMGNACKFLQKISVRSRYTGLKNRMQ